MKTFVSILLMTLITLSLSAAPSPKTQSEAFNQGLELLLNLKFKKAQKKFEIALELNPDFGEAHNNLAYCLRKQGDKYHDEALSHYNLAIELLPEAPQPYMYRGVLYVSMGNKELALQDHAQLLKLGADELANELQYVIEKEEEKSPEQFFGVFTLEQVEE